MALDEYKPQKGGDDYEEGRVFKHVGTRPDRPDGFDKVTGRARFGADMTAPGMLHGAILRSPHAHARIKRIDTSKAEALEGVKAVVTRADFADDIPFAPGMAGELWNTLENVMAGEKVL
ncbi:MAG TPA: oxidoreductase, partial [Rhodobacteraceae bacterium]|nr:oxidoreductase [Paracoccaceae bacterium]